MNAYERTESDKINSGGLSPLRLALRALLLVPAFLLPRLPYISRASLSGDESVFGLMSIAIARGQEYPLYCWGAHYASALISYIAVPVMALFGATDFAFRATTLPYGIVTTLLIFFALRRHFGDLGAWLSALCFALPLPTLLFYSVAAHGGYPETYFLGPALWIAALGVIERPTRSRFFLLGLLAGAIISILWLGVPFILAAAVLLITRAPWRRREALFAAVGACIGLIPFLVYNLWIAPAATILRLGGHSLGTAEKSAAPSAALARLATIPEWLVESGHGLAVLFAPVGGFFGATILLGAAIWGAIRLTRAKNDWGWLTLALIPATAIFNLAGGLTRNRHWSVLLFAVIIGLNGLPRALSRVLLVLLITAGFVSSYHEIDVARPEATIAEATAVLEAEGAEALIADYDLGYPIAFRRRLLVAAVAPPNPSDRRPDWTARIRDLYRPGVLLPRGEATRSFEERLAADRIGFSRFELATRTLYLPDATGGEIMERLASSRRNPIAGVDSATAMTW